MLQKLAASAALRHVVFGVGGAAILGIAATIFIQQNKIRSQRESIAEMGLQIDTLQKRNENAEMAVEAVIRAEDQEDHDEALHRAIEEAIRDAPETFCDAPAWDALFDRLRAADEAGGGGDDPRP